jgi:membrane protease YdiL (CAAX protease family)
VSTCAVSTVCRVKSKINLSWPARFLPGDISPELGQRRVLHPGRWRWLRALAWILPLVFAVALPYGLWVDSLLPAGDVATFLVQLLGAPLALGCYALVVLLGENRAAREISPRAAPVGLAAGVLLGLLMMCAVMAILIGTGLYDTTFLGSVSAWKPAGLALQAGVVEELIIRGVLLRLVWRAFGPWAGFILSAVVFGAGHLANPGATVLAAVCIALEAGVMLGAFYALTGRLWVSIGVHLSWNFAQGYLFGAAVSGGDTGAAIARSTARPDAPEWLTGGAFGPEASVPALLVCSAVGVAALLLARKLGRFRPAPAPAPAPTPAPTPA